MTETKSTAPVRSLRKRPLTGGLFFDYPPFNIVDTTFEASGTAGSNGRQPQPLCCGVRKRES